MTTYTLGSDVQDGGIATSRELQINDGGIFFLRATCTAWAAITAKLQWRSPDQVTWVDFGADATFTANGGCTVAVGDDTIVRMFLSGTPGAPVFSRLSLVGAP